MEELKDLQKLYAQYVFVYQRLTQSSQYFIDEFDIAKDAIMTITKVANELQEKIKALSPAPVEQPKEITFEIKNEQD